jgi:hypothetical protein|tara:strand:+ start:19 stop:279 length:261 start_codon:yes stop_codon:yes gene_type:complete
MAFKMKSNPGGPMRRNFPGAFKEDTTDNKEAVEDKPEFVSTGILDEQSGSTSSGGTPNPNKMNRQKKAVKSKYHAGTEKSKYHANR